MDFGYNRPIRIISLTVLFFFCWTFGGIFDIVAFAAADSNQSVESSKHLTSQSTPQGQPTTPRLEEKFQKTLDGIRQILTDPTTNADTKKGKLKAKKSEIEAYDIEIKKQFADTEKQLKEKGLPSEILERHRKFVKHYEDNLAELKTNLVNIDKAKTKGEADAEIERTKVHLEKVMPPKRYKPLDPNKLPHRTPEEKKVILEEWKAPEKLPMLPDLLKKSDIQNRQPVLVASKGSLEGLLNSDSQMIAENYIQLALVTPEKRTPASDADLAETQEVQFTPAIRAKAAELGNKPVQIYNWVRNNIDYVPTYGSIQGADMCLQTKQCNDIDTASLLITLFRVSGIHARYAYGTIERPIEKVMNWVGGFTDPMAALRLLASAGIPVKGMTVGGQIKYVQMEHVWVEAWIDYIPSRGAIHRTGKGDTWIPVDASYKQYNYTPGIDIKSAVPFDAQSFIDQITSTATINETASYVTNVNSLLIQQTILDYQTRVQNYITQNYPSATIGDVLGKKEIIKEEFPILPGTLHRRTIARTWEQPDLPDNLRHKITFNITKDIYDSEIGTPINITKSLPELAGKKITLSYSPATPQDEAVINSFLPKPHPDGIPILPSELLTSFPAYLINLKPELRIDGIVVSTGTPVVMGNKETFTMTFSGPGQNANDVITNDITAGNYLGIALDLGRVSQEQIQALKAKLEDRNLSNITINEIFENLLYMTALSYHAEIDAIDFMRAKIMGVQAIRFPSETIFSSDLRVNSIFGIPLSVSQGGFSMDADRLITLVKALSGDKDKPKSFMLYSGMTSSALEHIVPEKIFNAPSNTAQAISAIKALGIANDNGVPIYNINRFNIDTILPQLFLDSDTRTDIRNAVNAGKIVMVSKTDVTFSGWTGCGYIIIDPATGAGAYMISGGVSGAWAFLGIGAAACQQSWVQCYDNCIKTIVPINPVTVFLDATLIGNILYYFGGGATTITIEGEVILVHADIMYELVNNPNLTTPLVVMLSRIMLTASRITFTAGGAYLSWVAGSSYGCMLSCALNNCNY